MRHLVGIAAALLVLCATAAQAQVALRLNSDHFNPYEPIKITVVNQTAHAVSMCVSQHWIPESNGDVAIATTPFILQGQNGRKWVTILDGVDVGPAVRYPLTIEAHKSQDFQMQTQGSGKARFVLFYWKKDNGSVCGDLRGSKRAVSPTFHLVASQPQH